ncbi:hypothetical protein TNCV_1256861 [Trichonephila clavipes]|nr:hypothetical protein TNCV_1256861 [Trichonephila clavipes]
MLRITETVRSQMKIINEKFPKIRSRTTGEFIKLYTDNLEQFHELLTFAEKTKFQFYEIKPKNERPIKVVLKGLPCNFKVEEIQADLEELGFTPEKKSAPNKSVNDQNHINQLIKHKNNLRKRYQQTLNPFYKTLCNRAQANLKKELKIYSNDTWNARLEALNTTDNSLWEAQRFLKNKRSQIPTLNCATGMAVTDPQKANLLANTIKNNFIENNRMQDNYDQDDEVVTSTVNTFLSSPPSTQIEPAMPDEIINFIKNTSSKKAPEGRIVGGRGEENPSVLFGDADQESETRMRNNALWTGRGQAVE